jgi:uncharacterized protein (DUF4415 family)
MQKNRDVSNAKPWVDPDDAPEWTEDQFKRAAIWQGDKLIRPADGTLTKRGRPKSDNPKRRITLRLDPDVVERFQAGGPGWQSRMNAALRKAVGV